jgi:PKHD-type hydroxylase
MIAKAHVARTRSTAPAPASQIHDSAEPVGRSILPQLVLRALSAADCDRVVDECTKSRLIEGEMRVPVEGYRDSKIALLKPTKNNRWLYDKVQKIGTTANARYGLELDPVLPVLQYSEYVEGGHIDWHVDYDSTPEHTRKLSLTIQLSSPRTYRGGDLEFFPQGDITWGRTKGAAIAFPAFCYHRVTPVTAGLRRSLVVWFTGPAIS